MDIFQRIFSNKTAMFVVLTVVALSVVGIFAFAYSRDGKETANNVTDESYFDTVFVSTGGGNNAKAILSVQGLSCSSCIPNGSPTQNLSLKSFTMIRSSRR